jgi:hypothetical protein
MAERCDGTFTYVRTGVVSLSDRTRRVTLLLRAGHSYLAKPTAPKQNHPKPKVKANTKAKTKSITPARPKQGSSAHRAGASAAASAGMER